MQQRDKYILHQLGDGYTLTEIGVENCIMVLRDEKENIICVIDACNNKISRIKEDNGFKITNKARKILVSFIKNYDFQISREIARMLHLSIWKKNEEKEKYLTLSEVKKILNSGENNLNMTINGLVRGSFKIPDYIQGSIFDFRTAKIKKIEIGKECNVNVELRDNIHIQKIEIGKNFTGNINLSRSSIKKILFGDNCRCRLTLNSSLKCFDFKAGDVFSGILEIKDSCFHSLHIGYYCYAKIYLTQNWGKKDITIGDAFRGEININSVYAPTISIGRDCRGKINVSSRDSLQGSPRINVGKEFNGELNMAEAKAIEWVEIGSHAKGKINIPGSPSLRVLKFDKMYSGITDVSSSQIEYLRAKSGCSGKFILLGCQNLKLIKLPSGKAATLAIERQPIRIKQENENIYYQYAPFELPRKYFTPWYKEAGNYLKEYFFS